ncbi:UDP-glucose/GDP-mannose dehydrogenase family protein [Leucobacter iarius]|uniref:UDP-glucose 6-dehydrogenase n=1 Tax=Leucobacter iarius TaxID=333963 RepID=A0ABN2LA11_9MICO
MKISVKGCGYLGAVHAAAMATLGHEVVGVDPDARKIELLQSGETPFFEPGLDEILRAGLASGRLSFSTETERAAGAQVHFIAVGTPQSADSGSADLSYVRAAIADLLPLLGPDQLVVGKSTVPVGTAAELARLVSETGARLAWNPEFLREGFAVQDTIAPDRLVYGVDRESGDADAAVLDAVYAEALAAGTPRIVTDYATAELVKVAANSFLATKISFINAMSEIAETVGADVVTLADAIGHDERIGRKFLGAGLGFGGGCLPKDIRAFVARAEELGTGESVAFLKQMDEINLRRRQRVVDLVVGSFDGSDLGDGATPLAGRSVAMLGLSFKPNSDDVRDSPALDVAARLHALGAVVSAYDPETNRNAAARVPDLRYCDSVEDAVRGAEIVVLGTEWLEFRELDPAGLRTQVERAVIVDGRNALDPDAWRGAGWTYHGMGR